VTAGALRDLRGALGLLTVVGGAAAPRAGSSVWFGPVGAGVGALVGTAWWGSAHLGSTTPLLAAGLAVAADVALTGMLHGDGLADAADGLLPPMDRQRRLAVMRQPDTGAFGVGVVVGTMVLRWSALAALSPSWPLLAALWALSRGGMAATMAFVPYARPQGLASAFTEGSSRPARVGGVVAVALALLVGLTPVVGIRRLAVVAALAATAIGIALTVALAWRRVGGYTGDVLGAAGLIGETAGLVVAVMAR
jgi:adenosylcobinamide-GDP ribazoletransferase